MNTIENKINILNGEYKEWVSINNFNLDAEIADDVQMIHCDTRDFCIRGSSNQPKLHKDAKCGYEINQNKGLQKLYSLFTKKNREKYTINKKDIVKWLDTLCKETGDYKCNWRFLAADIKNCTNWDIKYIRFVRNNKNSDEFVVCNNYLFPIEYREIINNLDKKHLCAH